MFCIQYVRIKSVRKVLWFLSNYTGFIAANRTRFSSLFYRFWIKQAIRMNLMCSTSVVELDNVFFYISYCRPLPNKRRRFCHTQFILHNVRYQIRQTRDSIFIYSCLSTYLFYHIVAFIGRQVYFIANKKNCFFCI